MSGCALLIKCATVLTAACYSAAAVGIAYYATVAIRHLAGTETSLFIAYLTDSGSGITVTVSISVGVLGGAYGLIQRYLHRQAIAHFAPRLAHYEKQIDPNRSSSNLTPYGGTNPDDL